MADAFDLDVLDRRILARYQHNTREPAHVIGEAVGLSPAAVQRRIKRLRETGAISAEVALIEPSAVGLAVTVVVHVDIDRESQAHIDAFAMTMQKRPEVQNCWVTTGPTDFILVVRVASLAAYDAFCRASLMGDENVVRFTSHVVLSEVKSGATLAFGGH